MKTPKIVTNQVENRSASIVDGRERFLEIRLEQQRAADWLVCIEELLVPCTTEELGQFHTALSDACWLARWKREDPIVDFDPHWLPGLVVSLASDAAKSRCRAYAIEDILATLSRCRG